MDANARMGEGRPREGGPSECRTPSQALHLISFGGLDVVVVHRRASAHPSFWSKRGLQFSHFLIRNADEVALLNNLLMYVKVTGPPEIYGYIGSIHPLHLPNSIIGGFWAVVYEMSLFQAALSKGIPMKRRHFREHLQSVRTRSLAGRRVHGSRRTNCCGGLLYDATETGFAVPDPDADKEPSPSHNERLESRKRTIRLTADSPDPLSYKSRQFGSRRNRRPPLRDPHRFGPSSEPRRATRTVSRR